MSHINVWLHFVFVTKNRHPFLNDQIRYMVFNHIKQNAKSKGIFLDHINGYTEHAHCLISLNQRQTIADIAQLIKGESSFWINKNNFTSKRFAWQEKHWCVSISESGVNNLRAYIRRQESHHKKKSFQDEYEEFLRKYGFEDDGLKPG